MPIIESQPIDTTISSKPDNFMALGRPTPEQQLAEQWQVLYQLTTIYSERANQKSGISYNGLIDARFVKPGKLDVVRFSQGHRSVAAIRHFRSTYREDVPRSESGRLFLPDGTVYATTEAWVKSGGNLVSKFSINTQSEINRRGEQYALLPGIVEEVGDKLELPIVRAELTLANKRAVLIDKLGIQGNTEAPEDNSPLSAVEQMAQLLLASLQAPHLV